MISSWRQQKQRTKRFHEAARDAENQVQLFAMIFTQLAKQENTAMAQQTAEGNTECEDREKMRLEAMEVIKSVLRR